MDFGLTLIIAENEEGAYQPLAVAGSLNEAMKMVAHDRKSRMRDLEKVKSTMCVYCYKIWATAPDVPYMLSVEIQA